MDQAEYDPLTPDEIVNAVANGSLDRTEALSWEKARIVPRPEVLAHLGAPQPTAEGTASQSGPTDGPQDSNTVPGPTSPAALNTPHGTQDEPRDYQADENAPVIHSGGTEDEPRGYLQG